MVQQVKTEKMQYFWLYVWAYHEWVLMAYIFAWLAAGADIAAKLPPVDLEGWHVVLFLQKRQSTSWENQRMVLQKCTFELQKL